MRSPGALVSLSVKWQLCCHPPRKALGGLKGQQALGSWSHTCSSEYHRYGISREAQGLRLPTQGGHRFYPCLGNDHPTCRMAQPK